MKPYFAVYSSFFQRGYDQIIHDCAISNLPVTFLVDRAGIVGEDGETHQGIFDVSFLTSIPNIEIYSPSSYKELKHYIDKSVDFCNVSAIRYPRGIQAEGIDLIDFSNEFTSLKQGKETVLVSYGRLFSTCFDIYNNEKNIDLIKLNKIYPFSNDLLRELSDYKKIIIVEETIKNGCIGEHLLCALSEMGYKGEIVIKAIENRFVPASSILSALKNNSLDYESILRSI